MSNFQNLNFQKHSQLLLPYSTISVIDINKTQFRFLKNQNQSFKLEFRNRNVNFKRNLARPLAPIASQYTVHKANTGFFYTKGAMVQELIMDSNNNR